MSNKKDSMKTKLNALFGEEEQKPQEEVALHEEAPEENLLDEVTDEELKEALRKRQAIGRGRPRRGCCSPEQTKDYVRISTIAHKDKYAKIQEISLRESLQIKEVLEAAMDFAIEAYEAKHGEIKVRNAKKRGNPKDLFK